MDIENKPQIPEDGLYEVRFVNDLLAGGLLPPVPTDPTFK